MRGNRGAPTAGAPPSAPCCTASSSSRFPPEQMPTSRATARTRPCAANGKWRSCGSASNSTGACSDHPARAAAETSQAIVSAASLCRWSARAASCFVLRRRAGITQERGEHRDRGRVLNALRETLLGPGAPRIVRAGLPDRGAFLVAEGLPCAVTGRARPVRPARRRCRALRADARAGPGTGRPPGRSLTRTAPGPAPAGVPRWPRSRGPRRRTAAGACAGAGAGCASSWSCAPVR